MNEMILRVVKCGECFTVGQMFMDVVATELIKK